MASSLEEQRGPASVSRNPPVRGHDDQPRRQAGEAGERPGIAAVAATARHPTACFSCRAARQRCDRLEPCARCAAQERPCSYPAVSHRGRRLGSSNKPDTVEKLLLRIRESPVRDQVVKIIIDSAAAASSSPAAMLVPTPDSSAPTEHADLPVGECSTGCTHAPEPKTQPSVVSPLDILAAAVTSVSGDDESDPLHQAPVPSFLTQSQRQPAREPAGGSAVDGQLMRYFASPSPPRKDWQILSAQPAESIFKLESAACDPVAARMIDETDVYVYFNLFFTIRNPLVGLLDSELHTPEYIYAKSFALFSVICALGCAVSTRPRDKVIYPTLLSLAEGNVQWSVAASVRSLETIQAIILMQYWAPVRDRLSDDPYRLHLSHAAQLARELGINDPDRVDKYLTASDPVANADVKERIRRNHERCWLYIFIADRSFGIVNGRHLCVSWNEVPHGAFDWWRKANADPKDRVISGIAETRGILLNAFEQQNSADKSALSVSSWNTQWFEVIEHVRNVRCTPDTLPSSAYLPLLAFYVDHSLLLLSAQAIRELTAPDGEAMPAELRAICKQTVKVAIRVLDAVLNDSVLNELKLGFHNNQFIMICHAIAEAIQCLKRNVLSHQEAAEAASKVREIPDHLDDIVKQLPTTSVGRLYASLSRCLMNQLEKQTTAASIQHETVSSFQDALLADWWIGDGWLESGGNGFVAFNSLTLEQLMLDNNSTFPGVEETEISDSTTTPQ